MHLAWRSAPLLLPCSFPLSLSLSYHPYTQRFQNALPTHFSPPPLLALSLSLSSLLPPLIALAFPPPSSAVVYNTYLVPDWSCVIVVTLSLPVAQIGLTPTGEFPSLY